MAVPSICANVASLGKPGSNAGSVAATAFAWNGSVIPPRPMSGQIGTGAGSLKPATRQRFVQFGPHCDQSATLVRKGALGGGQRQPEIMRDRGMRQEAPRCVEAVAQMRIVGQCPP